MDVSLKTPRFSMETPHVFSLETPHFHWRPHIFIGDPIFSLKTPFFLETPYFHWRPPDSRLRPQYFHYGHHILFENPQILVGDPHIFIGDPQEFHWRPQDFHWKPHIFVGQPHVKGSPMKIPIKILGSPMKI